MISVPPFKWPLPRRLGSNSDIKEYCALTQKRHSQVLLSKSAPSKHAAATAGSSALTLFGADGSRT